MLGTSHHSAPSPRDARRTSIRGLPALLGSSRFHNDSLSPSFGPMSTSFDLPRKRPVAPVGFVSSLNEAMIPEEEPRVKRAPSRTATELLRPARANEKTGESDESAEDVGDQTATPANQATKPDISSEIHDSELALVGPPWAKEGVLHRKQLFDANGKRSRTKSWLQVFAVVHAPGILSMFQFDPSSSSSGTGSVGGGNWAVNAQQVGSVPLQHATAQALPPPGYSRARPHVVSLHLPGGAALYLQTSHEGLVVEWCASLNYWAARASQLPGPQGVTSIDYGWKFLEDAPPPPRNTNSPVPTSAPMPAPTGSKDSVTGSAQSNRLTPRSPRESSSPHPASETGSSSSLIPLTRP